MLIATTLTILGLLAGVTVTQLRGLRLGGVLVVPLGAVYLLWSFPSAPVFLLSIVAAYVSLWIVKRRLLWFGRSLFIVAVIVGSVVPVLVFVLSSGYWTGGSIASVEFVLSILPGIAAYNLHRLSAEERILDALWGLATLLVLVVVGIALVIGVGLSPVAGVVPPVLLGSESDIAIAFGLEVSRPPLPVLASRRLVAGIISGGLVVSELIRSRYGLRIGGVVVVPLVVLMSFRNAWMFPLWTVTTLLAFLGIRLLHWWTLLYGRVLLSMGVVFGLLASISFVPVIPIRHGLLPFFVGIFGGVSAYNVHLVPPPERTASVLVTIAVLVGTAAVGRFFLVPPPAGTLTTVSGIHVATGVLLTLPGLVVLYRLERLPAGHTAIDPEGDADSPAVRGRRGREYGLD